MLPPQRGSKPKPGNWHIMLQDVLPIFVSLEHDVLNSAGDLAYVEVGEHSGKL
jgi:hypothetical protein